MSAIALKGSVIKVFLVFIMTPLALGLLIERVAYFTIGGFSYEVDDRIKILGTPLLMITFAFHLYYSAKMRVKNADHSFLGKRMIEKSIDVMLFISSTMGFLNLFIVI